MDGSNLKKWQTTDSIYVVNDRWMKLRADTCITSDDREITPFYVMEYPDWISCFVIDDQNEVTLLRHYRHGIDDFVLELVVGYIDPGENPADAVNRELEEEIGLVGAIVDPVGVCYANPANQTNKVHCFVARGGNFEGNKLNELGADFQVVKMPLSELIGIIENQTETMQGLHLASILFALNYLKKQ